MFLGQLEELGGEVASAFTNAVNATVVQVSLHKHCTCTIVLQPSWDVSKRPLEVMTQLVNIVLPSILTQQSA